MRTIAMRMFGAVDTSRMATMWGADRPRTVCRIFVLPRTLDVLGAMPVIGRSLGQADFEAGAAGVALLTDSAWRKYFATDPPVVGRSIQLDEQPFSVVGIVPGNVAEMLQPRTGLFAAKKNDLCVITPFVRGMAGEANGVMEYLRSEQGRNLPALLVLGRLRPGVGIAQADTELGLIAHRLRQQNPTRPQDFTLRAVPFPAWRTAGVQHLLLMLGVAALLTLLVACANAAGLLMAESVRRAPEFATRIALGATPKHLVRVVVARSLLWSLPGGLLGLVLANVATAVLRWQVSAAGDSTANPYLRTWMLVISGVLTLVIALSSGAAAAWTLRGRDSSQSLRDGGQTIAGQPRRRAASFLLTMQVAAAVALAFGTGLLLRTLSILGTSDYGFDRQNGFVIEVRLPRSRYATAREQLEFYDRALSRIRALPGVTAAGLSSSPPLTGTVTLLSGALRISTPTETRSVDRLHAEFVSSGYFEALGMSLRRGRFFSPEDEQAGGAPIVVDETFCLLAANLAVGEFAMMRLIVAHAMSTIGAGAFGFLAVLALRESLRAGLGPVWFRRASTVVQAVLVACLATTFLLLPGLSPAVARSWLAPGAAIPYVRLDSSALPLSLLAVQTVVITVLLAGFRHAIRVPADSRANWIFHVSWLGHERRHLAGTKRAALFGVTLPTLIALLPLHAAVLGARLAFAHLAYGLLLALLLTDLLLLGFRRPPFAVSYVPSANLKTLGSVYVLILAATVYGLASLEQLALSNGTATLAVFTALGFVLLGVRAIDFWQRRTPIAIEPDERPEPSIQGLGLSG